MAKSVSYIIQLRDRFSNNIDKIGRRVDGLKQKIKSATKQVALFSTVGKKLKSIGDSFSNLGRSFSTKLTFPIVAGLGIMAKEAISAQETFSKFDAVFEGVSSQADKSFRNLRDNYGMSGVAAKQLLSDTGDMLAGMGFSQKQVLKYSDSIQKLAADLASFQDKDVSSVSLSLTKALIGERESIKLLGIAIDEKMVKSRIKQLILVDKIKFKTLEEAKAMATMQLMFEKSKNAIGDFSRTQGSAANKLKVANARFKDLRVTIGTQLIPAITKITSKIIPIFSKIRDWISENKELTKTIIKFSLALAVLGPALLIIGGLISSIGSIVGVIGLLFTPLGLIIAGVAALSIGLFLLWKNFDKVKALIKNVISSFFEFISGNSKLAQSLKFVAGVISGLLAIFFPIPAIIMGVIAAGVLLWKNWDTIVEKISIAGDFISNVFESIKNTFDSVVSYITNKIQVLADKISNVFGSIKGILNKFNPFSSGTNEISQKLNVNNTGEVLNLSESKQTVLNKNSVDITGNIGVQAEKGTNITKAKFNAPLGINIMQSGFAGGY